MIVDQKLTTMKTSNALHGLLPNISGINSDFFLSQVKSDSYSLCPLNMQQCAVLEARAGRLNNL